MHFLLINNKVIFNNKALTKVFAHMQQIGILEYPGYNAIAKQLQRKDAYIFSCNLHISPGVKVPACVTVQKYNPQ